MGKRNRQHRRDAGAGAETAQDPPASVGDRVAAAVAAIREPTSHPRAELSSLRDIWDDPRVHGAVGAALEDALVAAVTDRWTRNWQPADLARLAARHPARDRAVLRDAIGVEAERWRHRPGADPRWLAQLDAFGARAVPPGWLQRRGGLWAAEAAYRWVTFLHVLPAILVPSPGPADWSDTLVASGVDAKILDRVRALLAKAESTTFEAEAEALTAKAQQLMTRHAIDRALVATERGWAEASQTRRIYIDDPYATAKSMLLGAVARPSGCRTVWSSGYGFATVFGFDADLDAVELLFTSLLVQATTAMLAAGEAGARQRSRGWRHGFLVGFAGRIGQRLAAAREASVQEAAAHHGADRLLPVLSSRDDAVEAAVHNLFPSLRQRSVSVSDGTGYAAGTWAAERADLDTRGRVGGTPRGELAS